MQMLHTRIKKEKSRQPVEETAAVTCLNKLFKM